MSIENCRALTLSAVVALALAACATTPPAPGVAAPDPAATAAAVAPAVPSAQAIANAQRLAGAPGSAPPPAGQTAPGTLRPFAEIVRDAKSMPGLFALWQRDEKVWIEIAPEQLERAYFFSTNLDQGLGENHFFAGSMSSSLSRRFGGPKIVTFRKVGGNIQFIARNVKYTAQPGSPEARAVAEGFSDSLINSAVIVSQPHPERKSVLVEANALFLADLTGSASRLEQTYRQSYAFDARNSSFKEVHSASDFASFSVIAHYALARVSNPGPGQPATEPPSTVPDIRSLFLGFHYSLAKLPESPMRPRLADSRIGYFTTERWDFTTDDRRLPLLRYVNRWRLEKRDPSAPMSEPKQPIVYWIDRTVPEKYRATIRDGVLEWNKAFERIGFKDAIKVEIQPENADFNTSDIRHASIRWMTTVRSAFTAIGPSVVDPRTGEILDADIGMDATQFRAIRSYGAESIPSRPSMGFYDDLPYCTYAIESAEHAGFALALLEARETLTLDGPEAEAFILGRLKSTTMHEVGHTLGLTHNFRASVVYTEAQLADSEFTRKNGIAGSVMEYNAVNLALQDEPQGEYHMSTLGPYDYWAVEYGYKELPAEEEAVALARIAERSHEPLLAFMADDTAYRSGLDPLANTFDLGTDPLRFADRQLRLARELWLLAEGRQLRADESYAPLRRNFSRGLFEVQQSALYAIKYIGGLTLLTDRAGSGRAPLEPIPVAQAARRAGAAHRIHLRRRQLPLPGGLPAQTLVQRVRHRRRPRTRPHGAADRRCGRPAGARRAPRGARPAARSRCRAARAQQRAQGEPGKRSLAPFRTVRDAARGDLRGTQGRAGYSADPAQPAARIRHPRGQRPGASRPDDARGCTRATARGRRPVARGTGVRATPGEGVGRNSRPSGGERGCARRRVEGAAAAPEPLTMPARSHRRSVTLAPLDNRALANLTGPYDANLRQIEAALDVTISHRGAVFTVAGEAEPAAHAAEALERFYVAAQKPLSVDDIQLGLVEIATRPVAAPAAADARQRAAPAHPTRGPARPNAESGRVPEEHPRSRHHVRHRPRGHRQDLSRGGLRRRRARARRRQAHRAGASGGGSRRAAGLSARRPGAEGRPLPAPALRRAVRPHGLSTRSPSSSSAATIEIAPLAYMRGRTLNHSFIILDEAQNTTPEQMKMFLTRIGFGTKAVITGDVTQIDLARGQKSGLDRRGAKCSPACAASPSRHFTSADVVRHPLVQKIVDAYERTRASARRRRRSARGGSTRRGRAAARRRRRASRAHVRDAGLAGVAAAARHAFGSELRPTRRRSDRRDARDVTAMRVRRRAAEGRALNREFRGKDYATNVLTFVYDDEQPRAGDIVLCVPVVRAGGRARSARR